MAETIGIRPARADEAQGLSALALRSKAHWGYPADFMEACREELRVPPERIGADGFECYLAEQGEQILGYYSLERTAPTEWELEAMFVEPAHIGTGVGRRLIEHAKARASALGALKIIIQGDPNAARFYRAAGGIDIGERESGSIPGRFLPLFSIRLGT